MSKTITELIKEYFQKHQKQPLKHGVVVDYVTEKYLEHHNTPPRDPWRAIRKLHQDGWLIKVSKGVYMYDPDNVNTSELLDFPTHIKELIKKRDGYKCVVCGRGVKDGVEIVIDHIRPKDKGGTNEPDNGQVLCMEHNLIKKNYSQTEAGKRYFIKLYEKAIEENDKKMIAFCKSVFDVYNYYNFNGHIQRPDID